MLFRDWTNTTSCCSTLTYPLLYQFDTKQRESHYEHPQSASKDFVPFILDPHHGCGVGHCASRWVKRAVHGARALRRGRLVQAQPAQWARAARVLLGKQVLACARRGDDSDGGGRRLDAVDATSTSPAPPRRCAPPARATARTGADFGTTQAEYSPRRALNLVRLLGPSGICRPFFGATGTPRSARTTAKKACAHIANVIWRYQPVHERTS